MNKTYDVTALGELLIDFTENGNSAQGNPILEANPGGAPCNVLAMLNRFSHKTAFIGKVGRDQFGDQLTKAISEVGIDTSGLAVDDTVHTTLAFVHTFENGDRDFSFYRNPGADMMLSPADLKKSLLTDAKIFHYGSLSMTAEDCYAATKQAIETAKKAGAILSFDPNLRVPLWDDLALAKERIAYGISQCDILKIADNEILWFTGESDYDAAVSSLREHYPNIKLLLLSLGREGSRAFSPSASAKVPAFLQENTIETTGAGDTFFGTILHSVLTNGLHDYTQEELTAMLTLANAAASIITTKKGALRVMPSPTEIENLIEKGCHYAS